MPNLEIGNENIVDDVIIAVSNSYIAKYYLDKRLETLPQNVKDEIKMLLVTITEDNGGIVELVYSDKDTCLYFNAYKSEDDYLYDDIGAKYKISKMERDKHELFNNIALYCKIKFHNIKLE